LKGVWRVIKYNNTKVTAKELAKILVMRIGAMAEDWAEDVFVEYEEFTTIEIEAVDQAIEIQMERVEKFLGHPTRNITFD
jgi:hypothetical protein